ncbi:MAG: hypothetical protein PHS19_00880 [Eubacteriales bacterium]|nr:hypothetical protein [Eubacteriales bacterium]
MNIYKVVNTICLIMGIAVLIFGSLIASGIIASIPAHKAPVLFLLGGIIVVWSIISSFRHR